MRAEHADVNLIISSTEIVGCSTNFGVVLVLRVRLDGSPVKMNKKGFLISKQQFFKPFLSYIIS